MGKTVYVIGHRNPDTDSIASAIAYADFKRQSGQKNVLAAMAGTPNPQTEYILRRLEIEQPLYLADVHPKVGDVVRLKPVTAVPSMPMKDALEIFHRHSIRVLPVVDSTFVPLGLVSLLKLSEKYLVAGTDRKRGVDASLTSLAHCIDGTFLVGSPDDAIEHLHLFIGAMQENSFAQRIKGYDPASLLVITGDRPSIQQAAISSRIRLLVISGGFTLSEELSALAAANGVTVLSTELDTATASWLARLATPLSSFMENDFISICIAEPLEQLRMKLLHGGEPAVIVVDEEGKISGVATKSSLLAPIPYSLILVDHNELSQAVPGADSIEILEIIDHHRLGNPATNYPITFMAAPVGSTCTVVSSLYRERGVIPSAKIASLLLAGIITDTVILKSPTTTLRDREIVKWLEPIAGLDHELFGKEIFSSCSGFSPHGSPEKAFMSDYKLFPAGKSMIGIGQVEVVGFDEFYDLKDALLIKIKQLIESDKIALAGLMVTDITTETTLFLVDGSCELGSLMGYPQIGAHLYRMQGVMSRKKQLVPHLMKVLGGQL